jgi:hypothetical protein
MEKLNLWVQGHWERAGQSLFLNCVYKAEQRMIACCIQGKQCFDEWTVLLVHDDNILLGYWILGVQIAERSLGSQ